MVSRIRRTEKTFFFVCFRYVGLLTRGRCGRIGTMSSRNISSKSSVRTNVVLAASLPWPSCALIVMKRLPVMDGDYLQNTLETVLARILFDSDIWVEILRARCGVDAIVVWNS